EAQGEVRRRLRGGGTGPVGQLVQVVLGGTGRLPRVRDVAAGQVPGRRLRHAPVRRGQTGRGQPHQQLHLLVLGHRGEDGQVVGGVEGLQGPGVDRRLQGRVVQVAVVL